MNIQYKSFYEEELDESKQQLNEFVLEGIALILAFPVVSAFFKKILNSIVEMLPKSFLKKDAKQLDLTNKLQFVAAKLAEIGDNLGDRYIKVFIRILDFIPNVRKYKPEDKKHIAITIYYTFIVGFIIHFCSIKGLPREQSGVIKGTIQNNLRHLSSELEFDDLPNNANIIISNKSISPIVNRMADEIGKSMGIF